MILIDSDGQMKTLKNNQIIDIKKTIAVLEKRLISEIADQEVWDFVDEQYKKNPDLSWNNAALSCMDDWGMAEMMGY